MKLRSLKGVEEEATIFSRQKIYSTNRESFHPIQVPFCFVPDLRLRMDLVI